MAQAFEPESRLVPPLIAYVNLLNFLVIVVKNLMLELKMTQDIWA